MDGKSVYLEPIDLENVFTIRVDIKKDDRGTFTRIWEEEPILSEFKISQASVVRNPKAGTLRGLHFQSGSFSESKVIQCVTGRVFDVIVDLRKNSASYLRSFSIEIGPECNFQGLFIPKGFAHGYLTLLPKSTIVYFMDEPYSAVHSKGLKWDDPSLNIKWPGTPTLISTRDRNWPILKQTNA